MQEGTHPEDTFLYKSSIFLVLVRFLSLDFLTSSFLRRVKDGWVERGIPSCGALTYMFSGFRIFGFFITSDAKGSEAQQHFVFLACLHGFDCLNRSISTHYS